MAGGFCEDTGVGALSDRILCILESMRVATDAPPDDRAAEDRLPDTRIPAPDDRPGPTIVCVYFKPEAPG
jgi:hypothetical protein